MEYFQRLAFSVWKCIGFRWSIRLQANRKGSAIFRSTKCCYWAIHIFPHRLFSDNSSGSILSLIEEDGNNLESKAIVPPNLQSLVSWANAFIMTKKMDLKLVWEWCIPTFYLLLWPLYLSIVACSHVWRAKRDIWDANCCKEWTAGSGRIKRKFDQGLKEIK